MLAHAHIADTCKDASNDAYHTAQDLSWATTSPHQKLHAALDTRAGTLLRAVFDQQPNPPSVKS